MSENKNITQKSHRESWTESTCIKWNDKWNALKHIMRKVLQGISLMY